MYSICPLVVLYLHSTSNHNYQCKVFFAPFVVLYLHSTSNHNQRFVTFSTRIVVLYLHSTSNHNLCSHHFCTVFVVLYLHSTSNHNVNHLVAISLIVVLYLHSTSNHNRLPLPCRRNRRCIISSFYIKPQPALCEPCGYRVVLYLHSTSNHNGTIPPLDALRLYYIFILHQTTTFKWFIHQFTRCIISSFYIKPQRIGSKARSFPCCIISSFYIKPQPNKCP